MTELATTILVLANSIGDMFVVKYCYTGAPKPYKVQLIKTEDPTSVSEIEIFEPLYYDLDGDSLRCCVEGAWFGGYNIIERDEGDLTDYIPNDFEEEIDLCCKCGKYECYNDNEECEYCYAEKLGTDVYTCDDCGEKCFEYGRFTNTENGLYCGACITEI